MTEKVQKSYAGKRFIVTLLCASTYGISLTKYVFSTDTERYSYPGLVCLMMGFVYLAWYANPLLLASHIVMHIKKGRDGLALAMSLVAQVLALTTLTLQQVEKDEAGNMNPITGYRAGFYLWLASIAMTWMFQLFLVVKGSRAEAASAPQG